MRLGAAGLRMIEESEGWSPGPYLDRVASPPVWTAYFGETKNIGPGSPTITRAQGETRLQHRFAVDYAVALAPFIKLDGFTQSMYDALASFVWNCGTGAVGASTTVGRRLRARNWQGAADALLEWCKAGGHVVRGLLDRRKRERALFLKRPRAATWLWPDELRWCREYDRVKADGHDDGRLHVLVRVMTARRKAIWRAAQASGWDVNDRRERYSSLMARTR